MAITGETFKSAVSRALHAAYPDVAIYKEKIPQGVSRPYFSISQMDLGQDKELKEKYNRLYQMKVCYYSTINDLLLFTNLDNKGNELLELLKSLDVEVGDYQVDENGTETGTKLPIKGTQLDYKIVDDVLQVFANYPIRVGSKKMVEEQVPKMRTLTVTTNLK